MGERVADTGVLTTINLAIIAIAAVLTIIAILYGARQKRRRTEADRIEAQRVANEGADRDGTDTDDAREVAPRDVAAAPATPTPPPPPAVEAPVVEATPPPAPPAPPAPREPVREPVAPAAAPEPATRVDVPIAAPAEPEPAPQPVPPPAAPSVSYAGSPLTILKGLGPKVATRLGELGIASVGELAALDTRAAQDLDAHLGPFTGRMARDRWVEQARLLAAGDRAGFEAVFGKL